MITTNVINRTFRLKHGEAVGTCFTIDIAGYQYVVTARHVVAGLRAGGTGAIELFHDDAWKRLTVHVAWLSNEPVDVAILAPQQQLSPAEMTLESTSAGLVVGQQVYFLGFAELEMQALPGWDGFSIPLVRQGVLAGLMLQHNTRVFVIDRAVYSQKLRSCLRVWVASGDQSHHGKPAGVEV